MSKPKFKVGDKVLVTNDKKKLSSICCPPSYAGQKGEIAMYKIDADDALIRFSDGKSWWVYLEFLKNIRPEKIIIYRNGAEVVAKNTATDKTGVARCNPADEFDFNTGAKLAFERLTNPEPEKPKYYTGKVVCIESPRKDYTVGKIYTFENGKTKDNNGALRPMSYRAKDINHYNTNSVFTFVPLIED